MSEFPQMPENTSVELVRVSGLTHFSLRRCIPFLLSAANGNLRPQPDLSPAFATMSRNHFIFLKANNFTKVCLAVAFIKFAGHRMHLWYAIPDSHYDLVNYHYQLAIKSFKGLLFNIFILHLFS